MGSVSEITKAVTKHNETATKNEKIAYAMDLIFNVAVLSTDNHVEAMGLLECIKLELQESFTKSSGLMQGDGTKN